MSIEVIRRQRDKSKQGILESSTFVTSSHPRTSHKILKSFAWLQCNGYVEALTCRRLRCRRRRCQATEKIIINGTCPYKFQGTRTHTEARCLCVCSW